MKNFKRTINLAVFSALSIIASAQQPLWMSTYSPELPANNLRPFYGLRKITSPSPLDVMQNNISDAVAILLYPNRYVGTGTFIRTDPKKR